MTDVKSQRSGDAIGPLSFIQILYDAVLQRDPKPNELDYWAAEIDRGETPERILMRFVESPEYKAARSSRPFHRLGHFYSPVVNPIELKASGWVPRRTSVGPIVGIDLSLDDMRHWWDLNMKTIADTKFPETQTPPHRYYSANTIYGLGDATILRAMLIDKKPKKLIEVGSGLSSACILDTIEQEQIETVVTMIEPNTQRLHTVLAPGDLRRIVIIEQPVQNVDLNRFRHLEAGDILFIDSTHVLKSGSDVHFELFAILPILNKGVIIHFHDVHYPFEYPDDWIFNKNYSWNEVYGLRAFLMYNREFRIIFMNDLFARASVQEVRRALPATGGNLGGGTVVGKSV